VNSKIEEKYFSDVKENLFFSKKLYLKALLIEKGRFE
jgi:hypothetical protein